MMECWKMVSSGGTADRRPGGRSDHHPKTGAAQASAPVAQRATLPEPVFLLPHHSIIPTFHHSNEVKGENK